jgi:DNA-binding CsgD family transcriptional regulator
VAAALESSAIRAQARGGLAAAAAFLLRAATLTPDPARRAARALAAADTHVRAGALDPVLDLLAIAEAGPLQPFPRAQASLIRARLAFVTSRGSDGPPLLLTAAKLLEPLDAGLSRATYLDALSAATVVGRLAGPASELPVIAQAAASAPPAATVRAPDLLLDGMVAAFKDGYAAGLPMLRAGLSEYGARMSPQEELHWLWFATRTALRIWDDERMDVLSARHLELARDFGSLSELPLALDMRAYVLLFSGDLAGAARLAGEAQAVEEATGAARVPYSALGVMAFHGDAADGAALHQRSLQDVSQRGEGAGVTFAHWAYAVLLNSLGRYGDAFAAASDATSYDVGPVALLWPYLELIEAAVRTDETATAQRAYARLTQATSASGTAWALGVQARSKALLSQGDEAEAQYRESIAQLGRTRFRVELARAHLLYGEWLRRRRRNVEGREQLRTANAMFETMGMRAFSERACRELGAAGARVRKRVDASRHDELTAQEFQIARMARDGLSNPEIAGRLFISAYTVQYHLRKVFTKLGVSSRSQLETVLADGDTARMTTA